jgi:hypothetical protein
VHADREMSERVSNEINQLRSDRASTNDAEYITLQIFWLSRRGRNRQSASGERWQSIVGLRRLQGAVQLSLTFLKTNGIADISKLFQVVSTVSSLHFVSDVLL